MGGKRKCTEASTPSTTKRQRVGPIRPLATLGEALDCRLNQVRETLQEYLSTDEHLDSVMDIVNAVTTLENILSITYASDLSSSETKAVCAACHQGYTRSNDLNNHIKNHHKILQPLVESTHCRDCDKRFNQPRQLVSHERSIHGAQYKSRLQSIWPGFVQTNSEQEKTHLRQFLFPQKNKRASLCTPADKPDLDSSTRFGTPTATATIQPSSINFYDCLAPLLPGETSFLGTRQGPNAEFQFYNNLSDFLPDSTQDDPHNLLSNL